MISLIMGIYMCPRCFFLCCTYLFSERRMQYGKEALLGPTCFWKGEGREPSCRSGRVREAAECSFSFHRFLQNNINLLSVTCNNPSFFLHLDIDRPFAAACSKTEVPLIKLTVIPPNTKTLLRNNFKHGERQEKEVHHRPRPYGFTQVSRHRLRGYFSSR